MKYRKIQSVSLEVCTCEQKVAYNLAHSDGYLFKSEYQNAISEIEKSEIIEKAISFMLTHWVRDYSDSKYDIDAIFSCLRSGLGKYLEKGCPIGSSYKEIGKFFPALYLKK